MSYLKLQHVCKDYSERKVLIDISFEVKEGEFICLLGSSGSGKTTLLNCISGIVPLSAGTIWLNNENITHKPLEHRHFGIVFQSYALFPNLTVAENIAYGLQGQATFKQETVATMLKLVNLDEQNIAQRYPAQLSGGQQQRVALARALAPQPHILLLDEPFGALDAHIRSHLCEELRKLQRKLCITTIMVTHDQKEATMLADRIIVINRGKIEQIGSPEEIYDAPTTSFIAEFIGEMNFLTDSQGIKFGMRCEDIIVREATEMVLKEKNTVLGRIEDVRHYGKFIRLHLVLQDFYTTVRADLLRCKASCFSLHDTVAVTFPEHKQRHWQCSPVQSAPEH